MSVSSSDTTKKLITQLANIAQAAEKASVRMSSGKRINSASDDAAGLAIVAALESDAAVLDQAQRNGSYASSMADIANTSLSSVADITTRQRELAAQAANGTLSDSNRQALNNEYQPLEQEKQRILDTSEFNGTKIFNSEGTTIQVGSSGDASSQIVLPSGDASGLGSAVPDISTASTARAALDDLSNKTDAISTLQGQLGAAVSRVDYASQNAANGSIQAQSAASRIRDADIAAEAANYTAAQIRLQASTAMAAQANQHSSSVLALLR